VLRTLISGAVLAAAVSSSAEAATCGVGQTAALYESPEIQVYENDRGYLVGCHRATGARRELGPNAVAVGFSVTDINALLGGRWAWTTFREGNEDEGTTFREDTLRDLRTNASVQGTAATDTVAVDGALVTIDTAGVTARFTDGRTRTLSGDPTAEGLASFGGRVYWQVGGVAQSAVVRLPRADKPRARPKATRIRRCRPRPGARLVMHWDDLVVTSVGRRFFACAGRAQVSLGAVTDVRAVSDSAVAYRRGAKVGLLDVSTGSRTELAGTASAATKTTLLAAGPDGVRTSAAQLATGPASAPALDGDRAYRLDAAGAPQTQVLAAGGA
jgi:hypothetical protein